LRTKRSSERTPAALPGRLPEAEPSLAVTSRRAVVHCLRPQSKPLDKTVPQPRKPTPASEQLQTGEGLGTILAPTMVLATGGLGRCPPVGPDASSCRGVGSTTISNGQRQGQGHVHPGNPYREWASREAVQCALRCSPIVPQCYQRKQAKSPRMRARKAVAHQRARAC